MADPSARSSLRPVLLPIGGPFEDEYNVMLEEMYICVASGVAPWHATLRSIDGLTEMADDAPLFKDF